MDGKTQPETRSDPLFDLINQRYGDRLNAVDLAEVRKGIQAVAEMTRALQAVGIENGDEPFITFVPYRKKGRAA